MSSIPPGLRLVLGNNVTITSDLQTQDKIRKNQIPRKFLITLR